MSEEYAADTTVYANVVKHGVPGSAWLVLMWDADTDHQMAFVSRKAAERWLERERGSLPKPERVAQNHYYYVWDEGEQ